MNTETYHSKVCDLLYQFARQKPGIEPDNYGDWRSYRSEAAQVTRDLEHFRRLMRAIQWRQFSREQWADAFRSSRLTLHHELGIPVRLDYCTGQYFPTEFRRAACSVLASLLWDDKAAYARGYPVIQNQCPGDWLRSEFRKEFGRGIASRYFD
jgi:hypothetical protein